MLSSATAAAHTSAAHTSSGSPGALSPRAYSLNIPSVSPGASLAGATSEGYGGTAQTAQDGKGRLYTRPPEKLFVAMAGNIGSGKTTVAKMISQTFGFELFDEPVIDNRFLKHYYGDMRRWSFTLQMEFLIKRVEHHHLIHRIEKPCIQDRTLLEDPEIFAKYLHGLGNMTDQELDLYFDYYRRMTQDLAHPTKVIYLHAPEVSLLRERIKMRGREEERNIPSQFLEGLNGYYSSFPLVCRNKYNLDVKVFEISREDIRVGESRERFLRQVEEFLFHG